MQIKELIIKRELMPTILKVCDTDSLLDDWIDLCDKKQHITSQLEFLVDIIISYSDRYACVNKERSLSILTFMSSCEWEINERLSDDAVTILINLDSSLKNEIVNLLLQRAQITKICSVRNQLLYESELLKDSILKRINN